VGLRKRLRWHYDHVTQATDGTWKEFEEDQLLICPPRVRGYALAQKLWVFMDVQHVKTIEKLKSEEAFNEKLVLPTPDAEETKKLIRALVEHHTARFEKKSAVPGKLRDFVEGKGQGLFILLYGKCYFNRNS
jgi:hypothetical protein